MDDAGSDESVELGAEEGDGGDDGVLVDRPGRWFLTLWGSNSCIADRDRVEER